MKITVRPWMILAGLMAALILMRIFPGWHYLVRPDWEPRLPDPDAYYHFRQAEYTVRHFPHLMRWDAVSFYPSVLRNDAAGLYDLFLATIGKIVALFGLPPIQALWWVCLWFPPLCTAAILPFVYLLARRHAGLGIGLTMALWYLLLPGSTLSHDTIGICDHHIVEMLIGVLCVLLLQRLVVQERERPGVGWKPAWGAALPLAILQFTWLGGPLFLPLFGLAGLGQLAADILSGAGARPLVRAGTRYWLAFFLLVAIPGLVFPNLILLTDLWRETLAGAVAVLAALAAAGWFFETPRLRLKPAARLGLAAGALAVLVGLSLVLFPKVRELIADGLSHKSTLVAENQLVTPKLYFFVTGLAGILGPLAPLVGIALGTWRRAGWWIAVLPSIFFVALWCRTYDYIYQGALHAILLTGYFFGAIETRNLRGRAGAVPPPGCSLGSGRSDVPGGGTAPALPSIRGVHTWLAGATIVVVLCVWPLGWTFPWWLPSQWYEEGSELPTDGWIQAMRWLRLETPNPGDPPAPHAGVMTAWTEGQFVNTLADRPATASRYPEAEGMAPFFMLSEEAVRAAPLRGSTVAAAVRYVVLSPKTIGEDCGAHLATIGKKLSDYYGRGTFVDGRGHTMNVPSLGKDYDEAFATRLLVQDGNGFSHFRLIFETREQSFLRLAYEPVHKQLQPRSIVIRTTEQLDLAHDDLRRGLWKEDGADAYFGHLLSTVKIFEQVPGAVIEGRTRPGAGIVLEIPLRLVLTGRSWRYSQKAQADPAGHFRIVVPYATEFVPGTDLQPAAQAILFLEDRSARTGLKIPESAVQKGERISWRGTL